MIQRPPQAEDAETDPVLRDPFRWRPPLSSVIESILSGAKTFGLELDAERASLIEGHLELVLEANESINLTRITDRETMVRDHVLDAFALLPALDEVDLGGALRSPAMDVGTGAGFPGVPLAIARPDIGWILLESRGPKAGFLKEAVETLGLPNVDVVQARARDLPHLEPTYARLYRFVTARAVANLARVLREVKALVGPGGVVAHFKGPKMGDEEWQAGERAAREYRFKTVGTVPTTQTGRERRFVFHQAHG